MKRNFLLTTDARADLFAIASYIERDSPRAALGFLEAFEHACDLASDLPEIGRPHTFQNQSVKNARIITLKRFEKYLVFYRPDGAKIEILRVVHGARDLPTLFGEKE